MGNIQWTVGDSNSSPQLCHSCALPDELTARKILHYTKNTVIYKRCFSGPLAHPVERLICNEEVSGSRPLGSTLEESPSAFSSNTLSGKDKVAVPNPFCLS